MGNDVSVAEIEQNFGQNVVTVVGGPSGTATSRLGGSKVRTIVASPLPVYSRTTARGFHHNVSSEASLFTNILAIELNELEVYVYSF